MFDTQTSEQKRPVERTVLCLEFRFSKPRTTTRYKSYDGAKAFELSKIFARTGLRICPYFARTLIRSQLARELGLRPV